MRWDSTGFLGLQRIISTKFVKLDEIKRPDIPIEPLKSNLRERLIKSNYSSKHRLNHDVLQEDEMDCLAWHAQRGCSESQELLLIFCGRLIHSQAKKALSFTKGDSSWDYNDLFNSGCIGVLNSLDTWRIEKGHFTSWATYSIMGTISKEKKRLYSFIEIKDENLWRLSLSLPYLALRCEAEMGKQVGTDDLAEWLNANGHTKKPVTAEDLNNINRITSPISLDASITDSTGDSDGDGAMTISDIIPDSSIESPDEHLLKKERAQILGSIVDKLPRKQSLIIRLYYQLDEETREMPGFITFTDVVSILRRRFPNETWSVKACEECNRRALRRLRNLVKRTDLT